MYRIHLFVGTAVSGEGNEFAYPSGERHAFLLFSRQDIKDEEHDWNLAEQHLCNRGWERVDIERGGFLHPEQLNDSAQHLKNGYEEALTIGSALVVYFDVLEA